MADIIYTHTEKKDADDIYRNKLYGDKYRKICDKHLQRKYDVTYNSKQKLCGRHTVLREKIKLQTLIEKKRRCKGQGAEFLSPGFFSNDLLSQ